MTPINITKASGEQEPFDEEKLRHSLTSAGSEKSVVDQIVATIKAELYEGISTRKIYKDAFNMLQQHSAGSSGRYKLKEAIMELGPTGYPFEKFIAEILNRRGYKTRTGVHIDGDCVRHEVDVIAETEEVFYMVECKFHTTSARKCDVKVPLYINSRFKDIVNKWSRQPGHENRVHQGWVVTNTRFTTDALKYGSCAGLKLLSWDYPAGKGLKDLIREVNLHPITSLSSLNRSEKQSLLEHEVVFCLELGDDGEILDEIGLDRRKQNQVLKEARSICDPAVENS